MREVGSCDEVDQGEGDPRDGGSGESSFPRRGGGPNDSGESSQTKGMGDMGLLTCHMPALTNIDNVKNSIRQQYQHLFMLFKLFPLQSSLIEYQT